MKISRLSREREWKTINHGNMATPGMEVGTSTHGNMEGTQNKNNPNIAHGDMACT